MNIKIEEVMDYLEEEKKKHSDCIKNQVGACVIAGDRSFYGYNKVPKGIIPCTSCERKIKKSSPGNDYYFCKCLHAEIVAVNNNLFHLYMTEEYINRKESVLLTTTFPCNSCALYIIASGIIKKIYYRNSHDENKDEYIMFNKLLPAGIIIEKI